MELTIALLGLLATLSAVHAMSDLKQWIPTFASVLAVVCAALPSTGAIAAPPVPFYSTRVISVSKISNGSVVIKTKDSVDSVAAWYGAHLGVTPSITAPLAGIVEAAHG